ncbi:hypothetical protein F5050DRAFT_1742753 [Lentinula boryana]|uniref:Uncharacterized protein n=1 Tax=Lentinula boryana TaxID=40481 RepID=A0ABQ8QJL2_9AGAR|nr:hypothetical protein F5050DRAFT_1742753 [Lentinula boryana]
MLLSTRDLCLQTHQLWKFTLHLPLTGFTFFLVHFNIIFWDTRLRGHNFPTILSFSTTFALQHPLYYLDLITSMHFFSTATLLYLIIFNQSQSMDPQMMQYRLP